jgi:hypothetical protein
LAASGLAAASTMLVTGAMEDRAEPTHVRALNEFLNIVAPGHRALLTSVVRLPEELVSLNGTVWQEIGEMRIEFDAAFFNEGALERCIHVATQALGRATRVQRMGVSQQVPARMRKSLAEIEAWAHGEEPDMSERALETWIPEGSPRRAVRYLAHALSVPGPIEVDQIANWLVDAHEQALAVSDPASY